MDDVFYKRTVFIMRALSRYGGYYKNLEKVKDDYALVITRLRKNNFPEVFAGVPMQETRFRRNLTSPVCASGIWQFMPETAIRSGLAVADCELKGRDQLWSPEHQAPLSTKRSPYVNRIGGGYSCRIANKGKCNNRCSSATCSNTNGTDTGSTSSNIATSSGSNVNQ